MKIPVVLHVSLIHPDQEQFDAYGNSLVDTAAWALGRHPMDLRRWCASHPQRDDVASVSVASFGWKGGPLYELSYKKQAEPLPVEAFRMPKRLKTLPRFLLIS